MKILIISGHIYIDNSFQRHLFDLIVCSLKLNEFSRKYNLIFYLYLFVITINVDKNEYEKKINSGLNK